MKNIIGALALGCLLQVGCKSEPRTVSGGTIRPDSNDSTTGRRIPAQERSGSRGSAPASEEDAVDADDEGEHGHSHGPPRADSLGRVFDAGTRDFTDKVSQAYAKGWPPIVRLGPDFKPTARIGDLRNLTSEPADMDGLRDRLAVALTEQNVLLLRSPDDAPTGAADDEGVLVITGSVESERTSVDGVTRKTVWVVLRLVEPTQQGILAMSRTKSQTISER